MAVFMCCIEKHAEHDHQYFFFFWLDFCLLFDKITI